MCLACNSNLPRLLSLIIGVCLVDCRRHLKRNFGCFWRTQGIPRSVLRKWRVSTKSLKPVSQKGIALPSKRKTMAILFAVPGRITSCEIRSYFPYSRDSFWGGDNWVDSFTEGSYCQSCQRVGMKTAIHMCIRRRASTTGLRPVCVV